MIKKLFVKNYKGFKSAIINLEDINFFVGENSTGKTSIINLLKILSSMEFWLNTSFNSNDIVLGYFSEIKKIGSEENYFSIAMEGEVKGQTLALYFSFSSHDGEPGISFGKVFFDNIDFKSKLFNAQVRTKTRDLDNYSFDTWVFDTDFPSKGYRVKKGSRRSIFPHPYFMGGPQNKASDPLNFYWLFISQLGASMWVAPIRAKAQRTYEGYRSEYSASGEHVPVLLSQIFEGKISKKRDAILKRLAQFGKDSNLFDDIEIKKFSTNKDSPFEIIIKYNGVPVKISNVGYGVSQILPIVIEVLAKNNRQFLIQQPEVHLHPKAQAAFGELLFESNSLNENQFIIETHSDFIINRFRYCKFKGDSPQGTAQVIFFERTKDGIELTHIPIKSSGEYDGEVPEAYRDFFFEEELKMLEI